MEVGGQGQGDQANDVLKGLPAELLRRYDCVFLPRSLQKLLKLRDVGSKQMGSLVTVQVDAPTVSTFPSIFCSNHTQDEARQAGQAISDRPYCG